MARQYLSFDPIETVLQPGYFAPQMKLQKGMCIDIHVAPATVLGRAPFSYIAGEPDMRCVISDVDAAGFATVARADHLA